VPGARREPFTRRPVNVRRTLAGLLIGLLAALTPVLSAAPAGAAQRSGRAVPATESTSMAATHGASTSQENRRGLRSTRLRSPGVSGRRLVSHAAAPRHAPHGDPLHAPTGPGTGSADPTGPPSTYAVATIHPSNLPLCGSRHPAAARRAPPNSSGS
jgi:hypothetical protein